MPEDLSFSQLAKTIKSSKANKDKPSKKSAKEIRKRRAEGLEPAITEESGLSYEEVVALLRSRALAAVETQDAAKSANLKASIAKQELLEFMETYKVTKIPLDDRDPIKYKPPGEKKDVTKGGIETAVGDIGKAAEIWAKLPKKPTKSTIEIPDKREVEKSE